MNWLDIYHVAHWCKTCKKEFSHSQGDCDALTRFHRGHEMISCETAKLSRNPDNRRKQWFAIARNTQSQVI